MKPITMKPALKARAAKTKPNPYRIETETNAGVTYPTMVVFARPPDRATLDAMVAAHPLITVRRHQSMDPAGCVFQCMVGRPYTDAGSQRVKHHPTPDAEPVIMRASDNSVRSSDYTARFNVSLTPATKAALVEEARRQGLKPATLGRILIQNGLRT